MMYIANPFKNRAGKAREREMRSYQDTLTRMPVDEMVQYQHQLGEELHSPERLAQVYGTEFASAGFTKQAKNVATLAASMLRADHAMVTIVTEGQQITVASSNNVSLSVDCGEGFCQNVIATGREFAVENSSQHPLVSYTQFAQSGTVVAYLGVPIVCRVQIIGVLCVYDTKPRKWGAADVSMLTQLSAVMTRAALAAPA